MKTTSSKLAAVVLNSAVALSSCHAHAIVRGSPAPTSDTRYDCIAGFGRPDDNANLSVFGSAVLIAPGVALTKAHLFSAPDQAADGLIDPSHHYSLTFRRLANGSIGTLRAPVLRVHALPSATGYRVSDENVLVFFDPSLASHITPMAVDVGLKPTANATMLVAGWGSRNPTYTTSGPQGGASGELYFAQVQLDPICLANASEGSGALYSLAIPSWYGGTTANCCWTGTSCDPACSSGPSLGDSGGACFRESDGQFFLLGIIGNEEVVNCLDTVVGDRAAVFMNLVHPWTSTGGLTTAEGIQWSSTSTATASTCSFRYRSCNTQTHTWQASGILHDSGTGYSSTTTNTFPSQTDSGENTLRNGCTNVETMICSISTKIHVQSASNLLRVSVGNSETNQVDIDSVGGSGSLGFTDYAQAGYGMTTELLLPFVVYGSDFTWVRIDTQGLRSDVGVNSSDPSTAPATVSWRVFVDRNGNGIIDDDNDYPIGAILDPGQKLSFGLDGFQHQLMPSHLLLAPGTYILKVTASTANLAKVTSTVCGESHSKSTKATDTIAVTLQTDEPCGSLDVNSDGFLDNYDYGSFVSAFESGDPVADFNLDGFVDIWDYTYFVSAFGGGGCDDTPPPTFVPLY